VAQFAGPTKTSELEAYELKAQTATSRHFDLENETLRGVLVINLKTTEHTK